MKKINIRKFSNGALFDLLTKDTLLKYLVYIKQYLDKYWKIYNHIKTNLEEYKKGLKHLQDIGRNPEKIEFEQFSNPEHFYFLTNLIAEKERLLIKDYIYILLSTNEWLCLHLCDCIKRVGIYWVDTVPTSEYSRPYSFLCEKCMRKVIGDKQKLESYEKIDFTEAKEYYKFFMGYIYHPDDFEQDFELSMKNSLNFVIQRLKEFSSHY